MSTTPNRKRQPKGVPIGGEFASNEHDGATGTMRERPAAESFERALEHWGLNESDLPGIGAAWNERFAILDDETIVHPGVVARRELDFLKQYDIVGGIDVSRVGDTAVISFRTSSDDGDDDEDEYFDDVETNYFRTPLSNPEINAKVLAALDDMPRVYLRDRLLAEANNYAAGTQPVWHLLADEDELKSARDAANAAARANNLGYAAERAEKGERNLSTLREIVASGELSPADKKKFWGEKIDPLVGGGYDNQIRMVDAAETLIERDKKVEKVRRLDAAIAEAEALPAGELRDFLLAERPEQSYPQTEGTGRNKRTVYKKYRPTSDLISDRKSALSSIDYAKKRAGEVTAKLAARSAEYATARTQHAERVAAATETAAALHVVGWNGQGEPPARPVKDSDDEW